MIEDQIEMQFSIGTLQKVFFFFPKFFLKEKKKFNLIRTVKQLFVGVQQWIIQDSSVIIMELKCMKEIQLPHLFKPTTTQWLPKVSFVQMSKFFLSFEIFFKKKTFEILFHL